MELSETLLCLFSSRVERRDDSYVVEIPRREIEIGALDDGEVYRVAIVPAGPDASAVTGPESAPGSDRSGSEPPVEEGDVLDVEIEDIGDQGDGIARIGPGYVVIVPDTEVGERVAVEISEVRENMAFADVAERYDRA